MEANGPASIFSTDSYEQVLFNALFRMLKRLKHLKEPKLIDDNLSKVMVWFDIKLQAYKEKEKRSNNRT